MPAIAIDPPASTRFEGRRHQRGVETAIAVSTTSRNASASGWARPVTSTPASATKRCPASRASTVPRAMASPSRKGYVPATTASGTSSAKASDGPVASVGQRRRSRAANAPAAPAHEPTTTVVGCSRAARG